MAEIGSSFLDWFRWFRVALVSDWKTFFDTFMKREEASDEWRVQALEAGWTEEQIDMGLTEKDKAEILHVTQDPDEKERVEEAKNTRTSMREQRLKQVEEEERRKKSADATIKEGYEKEQKEYAELSEVEQTQIRDAQGSMEEEKKKNADYSVTRRAPLAREKEISSSPEPPPKIETQPSYTNYEDRKKSLPVNVKPPQPEPKVVPVETAPAPTSKAYDTYTTRERNRGVR